MFWGSGKMVPPRLTVLSLATVRLSLRKLAMYLVKELCDLKLQDCRTVWDGKLRSVRSGNHSGDR